jgi:hypothetical protein
VEEACKGERFVDKVLALFILQIVSDPEVLKELEELHGEEEQDALSSSGSLHRRHLVADIPGDVEAEQAEAWTQGDFRRRGGNELQPYLRTNIR